MKLIEMFTDLCAFYKKHWKTYAAIAAVYAAILGAAVYIRQRRVLLAARRPVFTTTCNTPAAEEPQE